MPRLPVDRQETYAGYRAKGMKPAKAAVAAGYATGSAVYSSLEEDPAVISRIAELTHEFQSRREQQLIAAREAARMVGQVTGISKAWVLQQLAEGAVAARQDGDHKSAMTALELIGKEWGMFEGGSAPKQGEEFINQPFDVDNAEAILNSGNMPLEEITEQPDLTTPVDEQNVVDLVGRLIAGNKRIARKPMANGSETDIAFHEESEPEETDETPDPE